MTDKQNSDLITSAFSRMFKIGTLMGTIGTSMAFDSLKYYWGTDKTREELKEDNIIRNMYRVADTLGNLKGGVMKIGQMLSLQEGFFPPEAMQILRSLQREAPAVPFTAISKQIKNSLKDKYGLIKHVEPAAYASASIGQVHRAQLKDGAEVVLKVQYPGIDRVITADMKNLKGVMKLIFSMFTSVNMEPIWQEVNQRLHEELDYEREASNMEKLSRLQSSNPDIIIPKVWREASSRRVLCMSFEEGISPEDACSDKYPQELKNKWAQVIFKMLMEGIFVQRFLHADPNLSNFSFCEDGRIIVYDFGCVKEVPLEFARSYARIGLAVIEKRYDDVPAELEGLGVRRVDGLPFDTHLIEDYAGVLTEPFHPGQNFAFGQDNNIFDAIRNLGAQYWHDATGIEFPRDLVFINRTTIGHFGNFNRLKARGPWGDIMVKYVKLAAR